MQNQATARRSIQATGFECFASQQWHGALRLHNGKYELTGLFAGNDAIVPPYDDHKTFETGPEQPDIDDGLRMLASGEKTMVVIAFNSRERMYLWRRGLEIGCVVWRDQYVH